MFHIFIAMLMLMPGTIFGRTAMVNDRHSLLMKDIKLVYYFNQTELVSVPFAVCRSKKNVEV